MRNLGLLIVLNYHKKKNRSFGIYDRDLRAMLTFHALNKRVETLDVPETVRAQTYVPQLL